MINVKELCIGNLVKTAHDFIMVSAIFKDGIEVYASVCHDCADVEAEYKQDEIYPVDLTAEIIEKLGFFNWGDVWTHDKIEHFEIDKDFCLTTDLGTYKVSQPITSLHKLQNICLQHFGYELNVKHLFDKFYTDMRYSGKSGNLSSGSNTISFA